MLLLILIWNKPSIVCAIKRKIHPTHTKIQLSNVKLASNDKRLWVQTSEIVTCVEVENFSKINDKFKSCHT